ncbi:autotransporter domain-containing protein [Ochrobactrum sp. Kaboul]|nr:autotransporter domain-containing protein [Ochrobactrum sp. Kaboul]
MNIINKHLAYLLIGASSLLGGAHVAMAQQLELGSAPTLVEGADWHSSATYGISADGNVIVGEVNGVGGYDVPAVWSSTTGALIVLKTLPGGETSNSHAMYVSAEGGVIVGVSSGADGNGHAVAWLNGSSIATDLGAIDALSSAYPNAVSADGKVIVGYSAIGGAQNSNHAVVWSLANGAATIHNLGTLGGNGSAAAAVSADGKVIVGSADLLSTERHAAAWYNNGSSAVDLGTLGGSNSSASGLSANGTIIVGQADLVNGDKHAVAWYGQGANPTDLGVLNGDTTSLAHTVSADGSVIIGNSMSTVADRHAVAWYNQGTTPTDLGTLGGATSDTVAVSANGSVIVGTAANADSKNHAVVWIGSGASPTDLGTLGGVSSLTTGVSADGTVIVGRSTGADNKLHAALWKLVTVTPPDPEPEPTPTPNPEPNVNPTPTPEPTPTPVGIDVTNTVDTVAALAHDTFAVMGSQGAIVGRLMGGSSSGQGFNDFSGAGLGMAKAGESWYGIYSDVGRAGDSKDVLGWMTLGHAFTDNFSAGATIAHTFWQDMPDNYDHTNNNLGGGIYAQWKDTTQSGTWYMRGSAAINRYDVERTRQVLGYTEPGTGDSTINGWGVQLEAGQSFDLGNKSSFGYYGGLSYTDLKMDGYTETNAYFPFTYSDVKSQRTTAYFGLNYGMALTDKVNWSVNAEIEQDLSHKDPSVIASADYIGAYEFGSDTAHTRGSLSTTVSYALSDAVSIGVTPYVNRTLDKDTAFGAIIGLSGKF